MANNVRGRVLSSFAALLEGHTAVTPDMVQQLRKLFEPGDKVTADQVTAILASGEEAQDGKGPA